MRKSIKAAAVLFAVPYAGLLVLVNTAPSSASHDMPACAQEDSVGCFWDAQAQGNGVGRSFWTDDAGTVHYVR